MYQILGIARSLSFFALLCAVVSAARFWLSPLPDPTSIKGVLQVLASSVTWTGLAVALVGQSALFPLFCRLPIVRNYFRPIDGEWAAVLASNWPAIQQRMSQPATSTPLAPVEAKITIIARLFHVRMNLASSDLYSTSKTIFVCLDRDPQDSSINLNYVYKNMTNAPKTTDSGFHFGAATLSIEGSGNDVWLRGNYWTNRNWQLGLNTAGTIVLKRAEAGV